MQPARDPAPLGLLSFEDFVDRFTRDAFREMNGEGGTRAERFGQSKVVVGEARIGAVLVKGGTTPMTFS